MVFWIFVIMLAVGIGLCIWYNRSSCCSNVVELVYFSLNILGGALVGVSLIVMMCTHSEADAMVKQNEQIYQSLVYQYENDVFSDDDDVVGKKELYNQIQEWNSDLAYYQSAQDSFWMGIYYPNVFDQFDYIELNRK
jgi:hypothetical protein